MILKIIRLLNIKNILKALEIKNILKAIEVFKMAILNRTSNYPPEVVHFENNFASYFNSKYGVSFCNATTCFEASIYALKLKKGDKVVVTGLTFYSFINNMLLKGIELIYMDIDDNLNINLEESLIDSNTKMILVSHLFGIPQDIEKVIAFASKFNLMIVEDCSHAHGAILNKKYVGTFGDIGIFSLQGAKAVSGGEGGIAITNNKNLNERLLLYGHMGRDLSKINFNKLIKSTGIGKKGRMHPLSAGLASVELKFLRSSNSKINSKLRDLLNVLKRYPEIKLINNPKGAVMGGFYYGYPFWIASKKIRLDNLNHNVFRKYPYPLYHKENIFLKSQNFIELINLGNLSDVSSSINLPNTEKAYTNLIFIDYNFIRKFNKKNKEYFISLIEDLL